MDEKKDNPSPITPTLCQAYRDHIYTKLDSVEESIIDKIKMFGVAVTSIVSILTLINLYLSLIG